MSKFFVFLLLLFVGCNTVSEKPVQRKPKKEPGETVEPKPPVVTKKDSIPDTTRLVRIPRRRRVPILPLGDYFLSDTTPHQVNAIMSLEQEDYARFQKNATYQSLMLKAFRQSVACDANVAEEDLQEWKTSGRQEQTIVREGLIVQKQIQYIIQAQAKITQGTDNEPNESVFVRPLNRRYDSRFEVNELDLSKTDNTKALSNSLSVFGVVQKDLVEFSQAGGCRLVNAKTSGEKFLLCEDEPYRNQLSACLGTAFLVSPHYVLTARHVVDAVPLNELVLLTGFRWLKQGDAIQTSFNENEVVYPERIVTDVFLDQFDIALIKLKSASALDPLKMADGYVPRMQDQIYVLGHPLGLPIKFTTNASITAVLNDFHCESSLDTYQGNSGSPVFDKKTHKVIGILTGGGNDFTSQGNCYRSAVCASVICAQEKILLLQKLQAVIERYTLEDQAQ